MSFKIVFVYSIHNRSCNWSIAEEIRRGIRLSIIIGHLIDIPYDKLDDQSQSESKSDNASPDGRQSAGDSAIIVNYSDIPAVINLIRYHDKQSRIVLSDRQITDWCSIAQYCIVT